MSALNSNDTGYSPVAGCFAHNNKCIISTPTPPQKKLLIEGIKILLMRDSHIHGRQSYKEGHSVTTSITNNL